MDFTQSSIAANIKITRIEPKLLLLCNLTHAIRRFTFRTRLQLFTFLTLIVYVVGDHHQVNASGARPDKVLELKSDNYDLSTSQYQIVVLNFYADWCPYSARWKPVFQDTAKQIYNETATTNQDASSIIFGQINCDTQTTLAQRFRITKFPTTKVTIGGKPLKKEYRGARTAPVFKEYIRKFLEDPVFYVKNSVELAVKVEEHKGVFIMYSGRPDEHNNVPPPSNEIQVFRKIAQQLREDCQFIYAAGSAAEGKVTPPDFYTLTFKPHHKSIVDEISYRSSLVDLDLISKWVKDNCIPLVREITFENAEELTEEGLPFVILFYDPNDKSWIEIYKKVVEQELTAETGGVTFLYADGHVFSHPLKHLGKTVKDLPLLAVDSFKHLFLYKDHVVTISQPGKLKQFIADLHSGKLDREFHFGPDPLAPNSETNPPASAFNKLQPSGHRYSFMMPHDEL